MHRGEDIIFKLQHIHNLQQNLLDLIHSKGIIRDKIVSISDKIGDILGNSHECFDYCAKDLTKIIEPEFNKDVYFPFSKKALKKEPFKNHTDHEIVVFLNRSIDSGKYKYPKLIRSIVNNKKHNTSIPINESNKNTIYLQNRNNKAIITDLKGIPDITSMESKLNTMPTYVILHKNDDTEREEEVDVLQICGQAEWAPKEILGDIYCRFFSYDKIKNIALSRTTEY